MGPLSLHLGDRMSRKHHSGLFLNQVYVLPKLRWPRAEPNSEKAQQAHQACPQPGEASECEWDVFRP